MIKRIRYFQTETGSYRTKPFETARDIVYAEITGLNYQVIGSNGRVWFEGKGITDLDTKKQIKDAIKSLGIEIYDEIRNFKKGNEND